jgi:hypothetical protein
MNNHKKWLALGAAVVAFALAAAAPTIAFGDDKKDDAPAPGSIADVLRLRDKLPRGTSPTVTEVAMKDGAIEISRQVIQLAPRLEEYIEKTPDGRTEKRVRQVTTQVVQIVKQTVEAKTIKSFVVTKDGKLEALDAAKLPDMLKKPTSVLIGDSTDVDARHLDLIKPGTVYLAIPSHPSAISVPPLPPLPKEP